jgi:hypothetical protein
MFALGHALATFTPALGIWVFGGSIGHASGRGIWVPGFSFLWNFRKKMATQHKSNIISIFLFWMSLLFAVFDGLFQPRPAESALLIGRQGACAVGR